jgi:VWFA-related protein
MGRLRWVLALVFCFASVASAQQSLAPVVAGQAQSQTAPGQGHPELSHRPPPNPSTAAPEGKIKLDIVVTDNTGRPVAGLQQQDFTLLDDKTPRPILSFREVDGSTGNGTKADPPVEVILLVDMANSRLHDVAFERFQLDKFLKQNGGKLAQPTSLMILSDQGIRAQPQPSTDGNLLAATLAQVESSLHIIPVAGGYDAIERMDLSLQALTRIVATEGQTPGKKMLIWIGQGWPLLENPGYLASNKARQSQFNTIVEMTQQLREARVTLYNIDPIDPGSPAQMRAEYYKEFLKGVTSVKRVDSGALSLPVFAVHTGGRMYESSGDLATLLNGCIAEAKVYYTLTFDPPIADHTDEYHDLAVKVDKPGMTARTNTSYYAEPSLKP